MNDAKSKTLLIQAVMRHNYAPYGWLWLIALVGVILLIALPTVTYPLGRDQGEFATIGRGLLDGRAPYLELWNPKPPAIFYVYAGAIALFGRDVAALRSIDLILFPLLAASIYYIGRRVDGVRVGWWATLFFGVFYFTETFWTLTQNDGIALVPMLLALVCAIKAGDSPRSAWWAFGAGVCLAWSIWFKYPFALIAVVLVSAYWAWRAQSALKPRDLIAFMLGVFAGIGGGALVLISMGAWDAFIQSAIVTAGYTSLGFDWQVFIESMWLAVDFRWSHWGALFILTAAGLVLLARGKFTRKWAVIGVWLAVGLGIMAVQAKGYDYHWLPMLPPLALISAYTVQALFVRTQWVTLLLAGALLAIMFVVIWSKPLPYLRGEIDQAAYYAQFQAGEFIADESLAVATYLQAHTVAGDSLFIWGFRPEVYYMSELNPAVRFIFNFPLAADWYPQEWRQATVDILWAALPPYVLVLQVDYLDWVTGRADTDSNMLLQEFEALNNWLIFNYEHETQIGNFFVWRRK